MAKTKAIILDIDETLSPDISWLTLTSKLGGSAEEHLRIYSDYKEGLVDYEQARSKLLRLWHKTGKANKKEFQSIFDQIPLRENARETVAWLQDRYSVCLITGSMDLYAQTIAKKLGVAEWYANTSLSWGTQGELVGMEYELDQAEKKLKQLTSYCLRHGLRANECVVVGDGENDLAMFKASGKGVLVNAELSVKYGKSVWKIIKNIGSLPAILQADSQ